MPSMGRPRYDRFGRNEAIHGRKPPIADDRSAGVTRAGVVP
jgi:hypothetical protein